MSAQDYPPVVVLCGGCSSEREVSLVSGRAVYEALAPQLPCEFKILGEEKLPASLDAAREVIFPVFHGSWGEDGGVQRLLEQGGFAYAGCDAVCSALCMDKVDTKTRVREHGVPVVKQLTFEGTKKTAAEKIIKTLGEDLVLKPVSDGSSVGLQMTQGQAALQAALDKINSGHWMMEPRVRGREFAIGVLYGEPMGIVEIKPEGGVYDYAHKYTAGSTRYEFPAKLPEQTQAAMLTAASRSFDVCGCRDFARVDFVMDEKGAFYLLEINTIPGLTPTSLMPKSASCAGLDFPALVLKMLQGAFGRHGTRHDG